MLREAGEASTWCRTSGESSSARRFAISRIIIDPQNAFDDECAPFTEIPAWWSGFVFHVLNARQISLYLYLCMLLDGEGICAPTVEQIRQDLGLSGSIVFGALGALDGSGFILRQRRYLPALRSRRNVYQRPACEFTILRLLEAGKIDGDLRAVPGPAHEMSGDSQELKTAWLEKVLAEHDFECGVRSGRELAPKAEILKLALAC